MLAPSGRSVDKFFQKTLILAFKANSALSHENETKIVKITHSAHGNVFCTRIVFYTVGALSDRLVHILS